MINGSPLGLYDFHARYYNPILGRWFNIDPALQTANPYLYCGNSPMMYVDSNGEWFFTALLSIVCPGLGSAVGAILDAAFTGAVIGAGSAAIGYTVGSAITGADWNWKGFGNAVGMGAVGGAIGGGFSALGSVGIFGSFGNTFGYNMMSQVSSSALTNGIYGNQMTLGSVAGMVAGAYVGTKLPRFGALEGGAFKNAVAEIGVNTGRGAVTGLASGLVHGAIDQNANHIWQGALGGAISGASNSIMTIAAFGAAYQFDDSYINHGNDKPIYRAGGIASLFGGRGISLGRTSWTSSKEDKEGVIHESHHYFQQKKIGFANFYGRTARDYGTSILRTGSTNGVYYTPGTLEYEARQVEVSFKNGHPNPVSY